MSLFVLNDTGYDDLSPTHFLGPDSMTEEEFGQLCDSLMEEAAQSVIARSLAESEDGIPYVYYGDIVAELPGLLEQRGFSRFEPKTHSYLTSCVAPKDFVGVTEATRRQIQAWEEQRRKADEREEARHMAEEQRKLRMAEKALERMVTTGFGTMSFDPGAPQEGEIL